MQVSSSDRDERLSRLNVHRYRRLVDAARAAGAGSDAEDAVQDVLARLTAGAGTLPADDQTLAAYAAAAVRNRARDIARRRPTLTAAPEAGSEGDPEAEHERRRAVLAFTGAVAALPEQVRAILVLDVAGWGRAEIAARLRVGERLVKRALAEHRPATLAAAGRTLDGSDCARLAGTLAAYATGHGLARRGGPLRTHLAACDACRAQLVAARRRGAALRALFPPPSTFGVASAHAPAPLGALLAKLPLAALVAAALLAAGGGAYRAVERPPRPDLVTVPHLALGLDLARPPLDTHSEAAASGAAARRAAALRAVRRSRQRPPADPFAARVPPGGCDLGTLGICGAEAGR